MLAIEKCCYIPHMAEITNDLIYEILKQLQGGVAEMKATLADHTSNSSGCERKSTRSAMTSAICAATTCAASGWRRIWTPGWSA